MATDIKVPSVGESISEGVLARWLVKSGEVVNANQPLFELETDKASQEIPAPATGTIELLVKEGEKVPIGAIGGSGRVCGHTYRHSGSTCSIGCLVFWADAFAICPKNGS